MPIRPSTMKVRRYSCPPLSPSDLYYGYHYREGRDDVLRVDASLLLQYSKVELVLEMPSRSMYFLDDRKYVLKLFVPTADVDAVVRTMRLASHVVPVPRVHKHGRSGNCCYIVMDFVRGPEIFDSIHLKWPSWVLAARLEYDIRYIVYGLQELGIAHHDLFLNNVLMDRYCRVIAVFDWDFARLEPYGEEYVQRIQQPYRLHDWDYLFARNRPFGSGFVASPVDGGVRSQQAHESFLPPPGLEHFDPYLPSLTHVHDANVEHGLDPLALEIEKHPQKHLVILNGTDGSNVPAVLDDDTSSWSVKGYELVRIFTPGPVSDYVRAIRLPTTSYLDLLPLETTREQEFARVIARERPDVVLLLNWYMPLSTFFFEAMSIPTDLCDPRSTPVVLRLELVKTPAHLRPASEEEARLHKVTAVATSLDGYAQPEVPLFVLQSDTFDETVPGNVDNAYVTVQRRMTRDMLAMWGTRVPM
ncbi:hypothetical protein EXIGLDRAFT_831555, partial [Exidia glandulosa HHB12029]